MLGWRCGILVATLGLAACVSPEAQRCGEAVCPSSQLCRAERCVEPAWVDACVDLAEGERCDVAEFGDAGRCRAGVCAVARCGDGVVNPGEACDDDNNASGDGCRGDCASDETCGNGVRDPAEQCDDGNLVDHDGCQAACVTQRCGDGVVDPDEACDDGGLTSGDGCSGDCASDETCGNGYLDASTGEECDVGPFLDHDGCASACRVEVPAWAPWSPASFPTAGAVATYDVARGRMVQVGGVDDREFALDGVWEFDGAAWDHRPASPRPPAGAMSIGHDPVRQRTVVLDRLGSTWEYDGVAWAEVPGAGTPAPFPGAPMAFLPGEQVLLLVGNSGGLQLATWAYDGATWTDRSSTSPSNRSGHALTSWQDGVAMVGGWLLNGSPTAEAYVFSGGGWSAALGGQRPPARAGAALAEVPWRGRLVYVGGADGAGGRSDTWEWNNDTGWEELAPTVAAPGGVDRTLHADAVSQRLHLVGPGKVAWTYDGVTWTETTPAPAPSGGALAFDGALGRTVLVGGATGDETWEFDGEDWMRRRPPVTPPAGNVTALAYDASRQRTLWFNSVTTFAWDGATWTEIATTGTPPPRYGGLLVADPDLERIVLVGGEPTTAAPATTWQLRGDVWSAVPSADGPPETWWHVAAYDLRRARVVLVVGAGTSGSPGQTWELQGDAWQRGPDGPSRFGPAGAYDAARGALILFGGEGDLPYQDDTWAYDGAWTEVPPTLRPDARFAASMIYDALRRELVLTGGSSFGFTFQDTWRFAYGRTGVAAETCAAATEDLDGDGQASCADPDCWGRCAPTCPPGTSCPADAPRCGDGACAAILEDSWLCPADCAAP